MATPDDFTPIPEMLVAIFSEELAGRVDVKFGRKGRTAQVGASGLHLYIVPVDDEFRPASSGMRGAKATVAEGYRLELEGRDFGAVYEVKRELPSIVHTRLGSRAHIIHGGWQEEDARTTNELYTLLLRIDTPVYARPAKGTDSAKVLSTHSTAHLVNTPGCEG